MAQVNTTRTVDHDEIRTWAEDRGGRPSLVGSTRGAEGEGVLRIDFGMGEENLEEVSWDEFFRIFDENDLAFVYQDMTPEGEVSYFCKFVARAEGSDVGGEEELMEEEM